MVHFNHAAADMQRRTTQIVRSPSSSKPIAAPHNIDDRIERADFVKMNLFDRLVVHALRLPPAAKIFAPRDL